MPKKCGKGELWMFEFEKELEFEHFELYLQGLLANAKGSNKYSKLYLHNASEVLHPPLLKNKVPPGTYYTVIGYTTWLSSSFSICSISHVPVDGCIFICVNISGVNFTNSWPVYRSVFTIFSTRERSSFILAGGCSQRR